MERTKTIKLGDPSNMESEMGPMATLDQLHKVEGFVEGAIKEGARLAYGGKRPEDPALGQGWFFMPTIFDGRDERHAPGPGGGLRACAGGPDDSGTKRRLIALANRTRYGLAAGIWTNDVRRAHRVAREIKAGTVWINTYRALSYASPFGGYKQSGYGREMGLDALREFTQVKSVWVDLAETVPDPFIIR